MSSPDTFHQYVPRGLCDNLQFRINILEAAALDPNLQRGLVEMCRRDCLFFINLFVWQANPNSIGDGSPEIGPFLTWEFQEEAVRDILDCIETRRDLLIEKSREMGASWLCLLVMLWFVLFHDWKKFLCISRNDEAVDRKGDMDSLFAKLDFVLERLPDWLKGGRDNVSRTKKKFRVKSTHSTITGQASTGKAGVGGRATAMFIDEFSQIAEDYEVFQRTSDTTGCRIFNGTHKGLQTCFYELSNPKSVAGSFIRKLQMHWTQHPDKVKGLYTCEAGKVNVLDLTYEYPADFNFVTDGMPLGGPFPGMRSPWYDQQCKRKGTARAVAEDLDINPEGTVSQFFDPMTLRTLNERYCMPPWWEAELDYDHDTGFPVALHRQPGGRIKMWLNLDERENPPVAMYTAGADISGGVGATPSCLSIIDATNAHKVLELATANMLPDKFAMLVVALCRLFKNRDGEGAKLCWEMQGPGATFGITVIEAGYNTVYLRTNELNPLEKFKLSEKPGWVPRADNKNVLLQDYRTALYDEILINRSEAAIKECAQFIEDAAGNIIHGNVSQKRGRRNDSSTAAVNHGDMVMADALAWMMAKPLHKGRVEDGAAPEEIPYNSFAWRRKFSKSRRDAADAWA